MKLRLSLPLFSSLTISIMAVYGLYLAVQPRFVSCHFDGHVSPLLREQCRSALTPQFLQKQSAHTVLQTIKKLVIGLDTCSIRYHDFQRAHVTIKSLQPFININNNVVLTAAGTTMPAPELQEDIVERLPFMQVDDPTISTAETVAQLFAFMKALPLDLFENHAIVWKDKTAIYLIDRAVESSIVVAHHATRFTPELMQAIAILQQQISEEMKKKGRGARKKIIDVRVKGQIIIRHMQGGEYESTSGEKHYNSH